MSQRAPILPATVSGIQNAAARLRTGDIVAYPTETVYGLAVDPTNESALRRLFDVKGRPPDQPVLLLIHDRSHLSSLADSISDIATDLMNRFCPGPLSLIYPAVDGLSAYITSGSSTVAVRLASPGPAFDLAAAFGGPITSTSANRTGLASAISASEAAELFTESVGVVIDGRCDPHAVPSTLVDTTGKRPVILREGAIPESELLYK